MSVVRDFSTDSGHIKYGDINVRSPKYVEWLFKGDVFTMLMGVGGLPCEATITKDPSETSLLRQPWSGWLRMDMFAMRPVEDLLLSTTLEKAAGTPGVPDAGGRPLFRLERTDIDDNGTRFTCTFLHQKPVEIDGRKGFKQLWYRIYWKQLDKELVLSRIDELDVAGTPDSMPRTVTLLDDYRMTEGVSVPYRVRSFLFGDKFLLGADFVASEATVNDAVDVPTELNIPVSTKVRNRLTGNRYLQPVVQPK